MAELQNSAAIVYADTFFQARRKLPVSVLPDVFNFIEKFTNNPTSRSLNYEKLATIDPELRSVRVNGSYRAIVRIPNEGAKNVYTLLWVDAHDDAYDWARRKKCTVNEVTNAVEIYDVISREEVEEKAAPQEAVPERLFDRLSDIQLEQIGVTPEFMFVVRAMRTEDDLSGFKPFLPVSLFESLSFLAAGFPFDEVLDIAMAQRSEQVEGGFEEAVVSPNNMQHFFVVQDEESANVLRSALDGALDDWRIFLHPTQRAIAERSYSGPARISGGPGTGKTVIAMHRANWLVQNACSKSGDRILFTTFTSNLAEDIALNLKQLCSPEVYTKIDVLNLDKWISKYLQENAMPLRLIFGDELREFWEKAISSVGISLVLPQNFYMDEYEKVVVASGAESFEDYKIASRVGRGIALNRAQKLEVWAVMEAYISLLAEQKAADSATAAIRIRDMIKASNRKLYRAVIVDEGQDFSDAAYMLLRVIAGDERENDMFIVGDAHQRIYGKKVNLKNCGINTAGRCGILRINYRTTDEIRKFAQSLIKGMDTPMEGDFDEGKGDISLVHGKPPIIKSFDHAKDEHQEIKLQIEKWLALGISNSSICVVARTNRQLDTIAKMLRESDIQIYEIKATRKDDKGMQGIRLATMHRVKGLEFDCVLIADVNEGIVPSASVLASATDPVQRKELYDLERSLLYVAATRAKRELVVTSAGRPSSLIKNE